MFFELQPMFAFGFSHLAMLGWLAVAAAPLLIHLWNRRRYREVPWAAIEYLLAALKKNSRRIQVEQWLLLAVRTLLIVLIVLALAEPYFERLGISVAGDQRAHKLIVLDASFSMAYRPTDKSRFERAQDLAQQIVYESSAGDAFTLVLLADPPQIVVGSPSFEPRQFLAEIEHQQVLHTGANLPGTLQAIDEVLRRAQREQPRLVEHQVYFLTDLQRHGWLQPTSRADSASRFRQLSQRIAQQASLAVIDLGQTDSENIAVTSVRSAEPLATLERDTLIDVELRNFGRQPRTRQLVELSIDGRRAADAYVDLASDGKGAVAFPYRFDSGGDHQLEVRVTGDPLEIDNHRWLALPVKETVRVLCVNGKPAGASFQQSTDYLTVALAPQGDSAQSGVRPEIITESELAERNLADYDAIFLCNVAQFTAAEARLLEDYLRQGGGVVFFLGDQVQSDNYNRQLGGQAGGPRLLPALLGAAATEGKYHFDPLNYGHSLVSSFRDQEQAGLLTTLVTNYIRLTPSGPAARTALAFRGGDPAIVEESLLGGRSIVVATSADQSWTKMPIWPSYVPIVQELLTYSVGGRLQDRNLQVGQALSGVLSSSSRTAMIRPPDGELQSAEVRVRGAAADWTFANTTISGVYTLEPSEAAAEQSLFAVNVDSSESDLTPLTPDELKQEVWPGIAFTHHTSWQNLDDRPSTEVTRQSKVHVWLLYCVLGLLFVETWLAWQFGHHRR